MASTTSMYLYEKTVRICLGCDSQLHAVLCYLDYISEAKTQELLTVCIRLITDERNMTSNRCTLLKAIPKFLPHLTHTRKEQIIADLGLLAEGAGMNAAEALQFEQAQHPLNRVRMNMGSPADLRGAAVLCMVRIANSEIDFNLEQILGLIAEMLASPDSEIRQLANIASRELPSWDEQILIGLICGLGDSSPKLAAWYYHTLAGPQELALDRFRAGLMLNLMLTATASPDVHVRSGAGKLIQKMLPKLAEYPELVVQAESMADVLRNDFSYTVRQVFKADGAASGDCAAGEGVGGLLSGT